MIRGKNTRNRRPLLSTDEGTRDLWASFTDITSTIALILFVLVLLAYVRNLIAGKQLEAYQQEISTSERKLRFLEDSLEKTTAEIEKGQRKLTLSEMQLEEQRDVIAESNRELGNLRARLQGIAVLRLDVLNKVKLSIEGELGQKSSSGASIVSIGDNGNILINEALLFEYNSHAIKPEARRLLDTLARAIGNVLNDADVRENVDTIIVQGHTDERGSTAFNRDLSAKRANAVLNYLFEANAALESEYAPYFASSAHSKSRPINREQSEAAFEQNRRIEISVVLKDQSVRRVIDEYMQGTLPEDAPNAAPAP